MHYGESMSDDRDNNDIDGKEEINKGPLSASEIANIRHIINDYFYRRRIKKMVKAWIYTIGIVTSVMISSMTIFKEMVSRLYK